MLTTALLLVPLACPPTTAGVQRGSASGSGHEQPQFGYSFVSPYGLAAEPRPRAPRSELSAPDLPLWEPKRALGELLATEVNPEAHWIAWALARVTDRPATAHAHLVNALADESLSAGRLLWWREQLVDVIDARDALADAWDLAKSDSTRALLAAAIALELWEASCPVAPAPDGACRVSADFDARAQIIRRDPISIEDARRWTERARELWDELDESDLAVAALEQELALAATAVDHEILASARMPEDLEFIVDEWRRDSGVREWERIYAQQVRAAAESRRRVNAFFESTLRCTRSLSERHLEAAMSGDAMIATTALLREATLAVALEDAIAGGGSREIRRWEREAREHGRRAWTHDSGSTYLMFARTLLEQCIEHGRTWGAAGATLEVCFSWYAALARDGDSLAELVPEPGASSTVAGQGVVGPAELDE